MVMVTEVATATTGTIMLRKSTSLNGDTATITTQTTAVADRAGIVTTPVIAILVITTRVIITLAITEMAAVVRLQVYGNVMYLNTDIMLPEIGEKLCPVNLCN